MSLVKSNKDRDSKKADKGKQNASHEKSDREKKPTKTEKETGKSSKEVKKREKAEKGHSKQASAETKHLRSPPTTPKTKAVDPKGSLTPKVHVSGPSKPTKDRANIPPPLALQHDNFKTSKTSKSQPSGTTSSSSQTLDVGDTIVIQPFTTPPPPRPPTPEVGVEGTMCLTMDDFDFESEVEKPPPLPPKDRGKLVRSRSTSSKPAAKAPEAWSLEHLLGLQRRASLESVTTGSVYSQSSYCEEDELDLVITPRDFAERK